MLEPIINGVRTLPNALYVGNDVRASNGDEQKKPSWFINPLGNGVRTLSNALYVESDVRASSKDESKKQS